MGDNVSADDRQEHRRLTHEKEATQAESENRNEHGPSGDTTMNINFVRWKVFHSISLSSISQIAFNYSVKTPGGIVVTKIFQKFLMTNYIENLLKV